MKALNCLLRRAKESDRGGEDWEISNLLFANDTLVFYEASLTHELLKLVTYVV